MDLARAPHNAQIKIKTVLTPIFDQEMGHRMRVAREKSLRTQAEVAALLSTPGKRVSQQQVAHAENGRLDRLQVTWARLEAVFGRNTGYVLIGRDRALYNERLIGLRYAEHRQKTIRKNANPAIKSRYGASIGKNRWR